MPPKSTINKWRWLTVPQTESVLLLYHLNLVLEVGTAFDRSGT